MTHYIISGPLKDNLAHVLGYKGNLARVKLDSGREFEVRASDLSPLF